MFPFFLRAESGNRFCIWHAPDEGRLLRGTILLVPPFAEELNKSRRMLAQQCRMLADAGFGVLHIDLYGSGDSSGKFRDARWDIWRQDVALGWNWLQQNFAVRASVWGVRLGALLAADCIMRRLVDPRILMLWQPVLSGDRYLNQFLRTESARRMLEGQETVTGTGELRQVLDSGTALEVAGYELAPELATSIAELKLADAKLEKKPVMWFELVADVATGLPPAASRVIETWQHDGISVDVHAMEGPMFWATQEITESDALLNKTVEAWNATGMLGT